jgi:hypothetical protein
MNSKVSEVGDTSSVSGHREFSQHTYVNLILCNKKEQIRQKQITLAKTASRAEWFQCHVVETDRISYRGHTLHDPPYPCAFTTEKSAMFVGQKPMNMAYRLTNITYIHRLTDGYTRRT